MGENNKRFKIQLIDFPTICSLTKQFVLLVALSISNSFHILLNDRKGGNKMSEISGSKNSFALIVVLFILLIIVGSTFVGNGYGGGGGYGGY